MESEIYYMLREKESGVLSKGHSSRYSWQDTKTMFNIRRKAPPKLYNIGSAKNQVTLKRKFNIVLEIIPITITYGEPLE
jgi:hypothetical protein